MLRLKPLAALALVLSIGGGAASPAAAENVAKPPKPPKPSTEVCTEVGASGTGSTTQTSPTTATTTATISAGRGLPVGTTIGTFTITGSPPVLTIVGPVVFTAKIGEYPLGTLTVDTTGTFDTTTGAFTAAGPITGSSGILRGVTGNLTFTGTEDLATHTFTEAISGTLCVQVRR